MRFLRGDPEAGTADGIEAFWRWWPEAAGRIAAAIATTPEPLVGQISAAVRAIDSRLAWELAPGASAAHAFVVSPEGNPETRPIAQAWLAAAPPPDATWEFHASRQPGSLGTLQVGPVQLSLGEIRVIAGWDAGRERNDVRIWHPSLADLPDGPRRQIAFLFLDNLLGEDAVERWIGTIDISDAAFGGLTPDELRAAVERNAATATGSRWSLVRRSDGAIIVVNAALKRIDHPAAMHHLELTIDRGLERLANSPELQELDAAQDVLDEQLDGVALNVGRITDRRRRTIHYVTAERERAGEIARRWAAEHRRFGPSVRVTPDPRWTFRDEWGG